MAELRVVLDNNGYKVENATISIERHGVKTSLLIRWDEKPFMEDKWLDRAWEGYPGYESTPKIIGTSGDA
jgi:hypothetical protein